MQFHGSHILSVEQFGLSDLSLLFQTAAKLEPVARGELACDVLDGALLGNLFFEPSTRTRMSFDAAFCRLGGRVCDTTGFQFSSMAKGESNHDASRVISGYVDIMVVRHPQMGSVKEFADASLVPVLNAGDGPGEHPSQALLDLYTMLKELKRDLNTINGLRVAMVGDLRFGRTVHSLAKLLSLFKDIHFTFVSPAELKMPAYVVDFLRTRGHTVKETTDMIAGVANSDVIYATRIQEERFESIDEAQRFKGSYAINRAFFDRYCDPKAILMHPLPRDNRSESCELNNDLNTHPQLAIFRQTDNGIAVRMAMFALVMGVEKDIEATFRPVRFQKKLSGA